MKIYVDSREQLPLWDIKGEVVTKKLDVGDYTIEPLLNRAHAERKSPNDLYHSIIQDHDRFRREILRAVEKNTKLAVFVECREYYFYSLAWSRLRLGTNGMVLRKIINTIQMKYNLEFIWCDDREDMRIEIMDWLARQLVLQ